MSNSNQALRLSAETLRTLAFGSISGTYAAIGTAFLNPSRLLYIVNSMDVLATFSLDGTHDHFVVPAGSYILIDVGSNRSDMSGNLNFPQNQIIYVKATSPSTGSVYLSTFYAATAYAS